MIEKKINQQLDGLYEDQKSKKFVHHLITSYCSKKIEVVEEAPKARFRCAITNYQLISTNDLIGSITEEENIKIKAFLEAINKNEVSVSSPKMSALERKSLAVTTKKTDTILSYEAYLGLYKWAKKKAEDGDEFINKLIKPRMEKKLTKRTDNKVVSKPAPKSTFGDLEALQKLKAQFEASEKK